MSSKKKQRIFAFDRMNFILLAVGMAVVILGMILMSGSGSTATEFNPSIFDGRTGKVAPAVFLFGALFMVDAGVRRPKPNKEENDLD